ncbi:hypothetical protein M3I54_39220 [Paraburkholderia sp. CNPSo 3274]|uniref:alpha/beta fold hydrolase n=1 Tax=Paraburkholderia sp. CNPSo 3274 TaxID=2940932 RepID=UPI0020B70521|nr:hypothetical protein [Paraburkholderia sp. CNPSo 3274]MCP3712862.1 hypothetical protein [Paraburkholderia sp. CNPSo 3274]
MWHVLEDSFELVLGNAQLYRNSREPQGAMLGIANALRPLDLPAQVVWGARDPYIPVAQAARQREVFPRANVVVLGALQETENKARLAPEHLRPR